MIWCSRAKGATYLVLPGRSATSWKFFLVAYVHVRTAYFFLNCTTFFELHHHHQQSSRGPGLSPVKDWRPLQHGCVQLRSRVPAYLCDSCPPDWASYCRRGSDATPLIYFGLVLTLGFSLFDASLFRCLSTIGLTGSALSKLFYGDAKDFGDTQSTKNEDWCKSCRAFLDLAPFYQIIMLRTSLLNPDI